MFPDYFTQFHFSVCPPLHEHPHSSLDTVSVTYNPLILISIYDLWGAREHLASPSKISRKDGKGAPAQKYCLGAHGSKVKVSIMRSLETALPCRAFSLNKLSQLSAKLPKGRRKCASRPSRFVCHHSLLLTFICLLNYVTVPTFLECLLHNLSSTKPSRYKVTQCCHCHEGVHILIHKHRIERSECDDGQVSPIFQKISLKTPFF